MAENPHARKVWYPLECAVPTKEQLDKLCFYGHWLPTLKVHHRKQSSAWLPCSAARIIIGVESV